MSEYLEERVKGGVGDLEDRRVMSASLLLHRAEARPIGPCAHLGLDPLSRARLGKDVAQGTAAAMDAALVMAKRHELEQAGKLPSTDEEAS